MPIRFSWLQVSLVGLCVLSMEAVASSQVMTTVDELFDGEQLDIAGPDEFLGTVTQLADQRMWVTSGRKRVALRMSDGARMNAEERTFGSFEPPRLELPIALEYSNKTGRLYTLTEDEIPGHATQACRWVLYCEDATAPGSPVLKAYFRFLSACPLGEDCSHPYHFPGFDDLLTFKVWEAATPTGPEILVVLSKTRVMVFRLVQPSSGPWYFEQVGAANELFNEYVNNPAQKWFKDSIPAGQPGDIDVYKAAQLASLSLQVLQGKLVAHVLVTMGAYDVKRPHPNMVIACDLDSPNYAVPHFDLDPSGGVQYAFYNPLPASVLPNGQATYEQKSWNSANDVDAFEDASGSYVHLACGRNNQVLELPTTSLLSSLSYGTSRRLPVLDTADQLEVLADRLDPRNRFFTVSSTGFHVCRVSGSTVTVSSTVNEPSGVGAAKDVVRSRVPTTPSGYKETAWAALQDTVDHLIKVYDVTTDASPVALVHQLFGINSTDGAVYHNGSVYALNFGGAFRCVLTGTPAHFQVDPSSFKPSEVPLGSGVVAVTEQLDLGSLLDSQSQTIYRLVTTDANGRFTEFNLSLSGAIEDPLRFSPEPTVTPPPGSGWAWAPTGHPLYSNDILYMAFGPGNDQKWILLDLVNFNLPNAPLGYRNYQVYLVAYGINSSGTWENRACGRSPVLSVPLSDPKLSTTVTVTQQGGRHYALVGHERGFCLFDIEGLNSANPTIPDAVNYNLDEDAWGIAVAQDRVFVYLNGTIAIQVYEFQTNPTVALNLKSTIPSSSFQVTNSAGLLANPGGVYKARSFLHGSGPEWNVAFAGTPHALQMRWDPTSPDTLTKVGEWHSFYEAHLQDIRPEDIPAFGSGKHLLIVKDGETIAIVRPN